MSNNKLNARQFYYEFIAPEEKQKNYYEAKQKDIWIEFLKSPTMKDLFLFKPCISNDYLLEKLMKEIMEISDIKLKKRLGQIFVAKRKKYVPNASALMVNRSYDGDLIFFYVGLSNACVQFSILFVKFLNIRMLREKNDSTSEIKKLMRELSVDAIKLTLAVTRWNIYFENHVYLENDLILDFCDEKNALQAMRFSGLIDKFILGHEIAHHLLGHTGKDNDGSQYLQSLLTNNNVSTSGTEMHLKEFQADALAFLLISGYTRNLSMDLKRAEDLLADATIGSLLMFIILEQLTSNKISSKSHPSAEDRYNHCLSILHSLENNQFALSFLEDLEQFRRLMNETRKIVLLNSSRWYKNPFKWFRRRKAVKKVITASPEEYTGNSHSYWDVMEKRMRNGEIP
jgi:hypothetical protein